MQFDRILYIRQDGPLPSSYLEASSLVAAFKGVVYDTTNRWRKHKATKPFRVAKLSFDNLSRTLKIEQLANYVNAPEPTKQSVAQIGQILKDVGLVVSAGKPANFTHRGGNVQRERCDSCIADNDPCKWDNTDEPTMSCNYCSQWGRPCTWTLGADRKNWRHPAALYVSKPPMHYDVFDAPARNFQRLDAEGRIVSTDQLLGEGDMGDDEEEEEEESDEGSDGY